MGGENNRITHGMWGTRVYRIWNNMKNRCDNKSSRKRHLYYDKGIKYCEKWTTFEGFFEDMGLPPKETYTLDRINSDLGYFKENCRWASPSTQSSNRKTSSNMGIKHITKVERKNKPLFLVSVCPMKHFRFISLSQALEARGILLEYRKNILKFRRTL